MTTRGSAAYGVPLFAKVVGADRSGNLDASPAINSALLGGGTVYLPAGTYKIDSTLAITQTGTKLIGSGRGDTILVCSSANTAGITIASALNLVEISDFSLTRTATATSGGDGIKCSTVTIGQANIHDVLVEKHYNGFSLGPTDFSSVKDVISQQNINDGFYITNTASDGACQWFFNGGVLSQKNGRNGLRVEITAGPAQMTVGQVSGFNTFANSGQGVIYLGSAGVPIQGVRVKDCFLGEDGESELYLDTYGAQHQVSNCFLELAGTRTTGPTLSTSASNTGHGLLVTSNNSDCLVTACNAAGNSLNGFALQAATNSLFSCQATNNGNAATATQQNGVRVLGTARCSIVGGRFGNRTGTLQKYGVYGADGANVSIVGVDLTNNATAVWNMVSNEPSLIAVGNFPADTKVALSPSGAILVGSTATGDWAAAGTINVSGGLLKNDTAYTNP